MYYACLCGHSELVEYLLVNGARCEANTFDGERCLYGSLTVHIRNILLRFNIVTSHIIRRDLFEEFLRKLLESGEFSDTTFIVHGVKFTVHRCILSARCGYFNDIFQQKWKYRNVIKLNNKLVKPQAFRSLLQFLYTARLDSQLEDVADCIRLAKQCKLNDLRHELEEAVKKVDSFACTKPGTKVTTVLVEKPALSSELQQDLGVLAEQALPSELSDWIVGSELPLMPSVPSTFVDVCFFVQGHRFMCHRVFFSGRSEYFRALLSDHFNESLQDYSQGIMYINLHDVEAKVFACIVHYIYENSVQFTEEIVYDVLCAADVYLLPGLKKLCGHFLATVVNDECVVPLIRTARIFQLPRLENQCTEFLAKNLTTMVNNEDFRSLIVEDAKALKDRQETDTIEVLDDIRYHITGSLESLSYEVIDKANENLRLIEDMLEDMGLDA
ncbi:ankyrin repeat and BTB/POZ domain-containing protein 1-like isoform X2 [Artemia franciscana]|uniref:ankyrin repeat and BTB/POZ domain-containing protein 1-like isoform X2 n=1 Tax=Artemia franciscana TaxID=6661 RepID=UPI0032DBA6D7